jgi:hypothetical protein
MMKRTARLALLYTLEAIAALLALAIFGVALALWRLAAGPVAVDMFASELEARTARAFGAGRAEIGALLLSYDPQLATLVLRAEEVQVFGDSGQIISAARHIEAGLALDLLLIGRFAPVRVDADGGSFAVVRRADGSFAAGLGHAEYVAARSDDNLGGLDARLAIFNQAAQSSMLDRLVQIDLRGADIRYVDHHDGLTLLFEDTRADVDLTEDRIDADLSGTLLSSAGETPIALGLETGRDFQSLFIDLRVRELVPSSISAQRGRTEMLGRFNAPLNLDLVLDASREQGLTSALIDLEVGAGHWLAANGREPIERGTLRLSYDTTAGRIDLDVLQIESSLVQLDLQGELTGLSGYEDALPSRARYRLRSGPGSIDTGGVFPEPLVWTSADMRGDLDRRALRVGFDQLDLSVERAQASFTGAVSLQQVEERWLPNLTIEGPIEGRIGKEDVLRYWPVDFALGARDWIRDSIIGGSLFDAHLDLDIPARAIAERQLEDEALSLRFNFADADVRYVSTMTPLTGLSGEAELLGNSLTLDGRGGQIGSLQAETIYVRIPRLNPKGAMARFGGTGRGAARDLIALLDEEPMGFATAYGIDPAAFDGEGAIRFEIGRPMRRHVAVEDVDFDVTAQFENVSGPAGVGDVRFTDADVELVANPDGLVGTGEADLAGSRASIRWEESFNTPEDQPSTLITVFSIAGAGTLDQFGLPVRRFLNGPVGVDARLLGNGFDFRNATLTLDMADAAIALPGELWQKPPGVPAAATLTLSIEPNGEIHVDELAATAPTARIAANAVLEPGGRLVRASAEEVFVEGLLDVALMADRASQGDDRLHIAVNGSYLNARTLFDELPFPRTGGSDGTSSGLPLLFEAGVDTVEVRGESFTNARLYLDSVERGIRGFSFSGQTRAGPVEVRFGPDGDLEGPRQLVVNSADASALLRAFTGFDNASGGDLYLEARAPTLGEAGPMEGRLEANGFVLERMPLLARILAAGSLEGLGSLLSGQGLVFERLEGQFVWQNGVLEMPEARVAGPALGVTWTGLVDTATQRVAIDGTLLPSYGVNSVLGDLPLVGGLLTSRQGEGVIGVTFSVQGEFDETRVTANPLSALAPGVLRRIFEGTSAERELDALEAERLERERSREPSQADPGETIDEASPTADEAGATDETLEPQP